MILPDYHIGPSNIAGAGKGLFIDEPVACGRLITAPDDIRSVHRMDDVLAMPNREQALAATVRWFEDRYTVSLDWPDECYINHAFKPSGLWHLGFVFAMNNLPSGSEITVDYRHLLAPGQEEEFRDAQTGLPIIGLSWQESLSTSTATLATLFG